MRRPKDKIIAGIDLHGNNLVIALINHEGKRLGHQTLDCELEQVVNYLKPYKAQIQSMAVESTFNWYWLVDGLRALGYPIDLANPARITQYSGIKHADDKHDAFHLAELQRLKILPRAHVYDPQLRPVRDLLRRRTSLVHQRTALMLSFKGLYARTHGESLPTSQLRQSKPQAALELYDHPANQLIAQVQLEHMEALSKSIGRIEKVVLECASQLPFYERLLTLPGIGRILGMTITMEVGDIRRFEDDGHFASYCRLVGSKRLSNGKQKGENNAKCGNKYLSWAFMEAANFARRHDQEFRRWHDRKARKSCPVLATKALACKMAKAAWHVMSKNADYDARRMFPHLAGKEH